MQWRSFIVFSIAVAVMVVSGSAFINKMVHFAMTMSGQGVEGFGAAAVASYLLGMLPIVLIMMWAILTGRFRDIEGPKHRMLEMQAEFDRWDTRATTGGRRG